MEPQPNLAIVATIQQAITSLLTTSEPAFLRFGNSLFISFATILIVWQGIRMMLTQDSLGDHMFEFAKLLLFISFGYALIAFYQSPIPGIGVSFSHLITDQTQEFANILDARSLELVFDHLDQLWQQFVQPDAWAILANLLYWLLLIVVTLAKVISLAVVAFGLIASAVCALVGPIFVPFFIVPIIGVVVASFVQSDGFGGIIPSFTLENYKGVFTSGLTYQLYWATLKFSPIRCLHRLAASNGWTASSITG